LKLHPPPSPLPSREGEELGMLSLHVYQVDAVSGIVKLICKYADYMYNDDYILFMGKAGDSLFPGN
jgi:hypothetical protein